MAINPLGFALGGAADAKADRERRALAERGMDLQAESLELEKSRFENEKLLEQSNQVQKTLSGLLDNYVTMRANYNGDPNNPDFIEAEKGLAQSMLTLAARAEQNSLPGISVENVRARIAGARDSTLTASQRAALEAQQTAFKAAETKRASKEQGLSEREGAKLAGTAETPVVVGQGDTLVDPGSGRVLAKGEPKPPTGTTTDSLLDDFGNLRPVASNAIGRLVSRRYGGLWNPDTQQITGLDPQEARLADQLQAMSAMLILSRQAKSVDTAVLKATQQLEQIILNTPQALPADAVRLTRGNEKLNSRQVERLSGMLTAGQVYQIKGSLWRWTGAKFVEVKVSDGEQ